VLKLLTNLNVGPRLGVAFGVLLLVIVALCAYGTLGANRLAHDLATTVHVDLTRVQLAQRLQQRAGTVARATREMLLIDSAAQSKPLRDATKTALDESQVELGKLAAMGEDAEVAAVKAGLDDFNKAVVNYLGALDSGNQGEARSTLLLELRPMQVSYEIALGELTEAVAEQTSARAGEGEASARLAVNVMLTIGVLGLAIGVAAAVTIGRSIVQPLERAIEAARRVQHGDLTSRLDSHSRDEIGRLLRSMDDMQQHLRGVIHDVLRAARDVATSADELAHGNAELSQRTERSAGNLQQTAAAVEEISNTVAGSSAKSREASSVATRAGNAVVEGEVAMDKLGETMNRIATSSTRIKDIIAVIDGIAFQTNILALNAAVEAARAGEQGRGFAVVAGEVRTLAARAGAAAREIKQLIDDSTERVADGTSTVADAGEHIRSVVKQVMAVRALIEEVSSASQEQATGMSSVNASVNALDDNTQHNASLVEEIAATAESLKANAQRLVSTVEFFRLPQDTSA
jgi:methyl-accepting chemotaxis protein